MTQKWFKLLKKLNKIRALYLFIKNQCRHFITQTVVKFEAIICYTYVGKEVVHVFIPSINLKLILLEHMHVISSSFNVYQVIYLEPLHQFVYLLFGL